MTNGNGWACMFGPVKDVVHIINFILYNTCMYICIYKNEENIFPISKLMHRCVLQIEGY